MTIDGNDATKCLKVLKRNLAEYDKRHRLRFLNTSRFFMRSDIRVAKDLASDLRHVGWTRLRSKQRNVRRNLRHQDNLLGGKDENEKETKGGLFGKSNESTPSNKSTGGLFGAGDKNIESRSSGGTLKSADTVEAVVRSTLRDSFSGFSALENQILATETTLSPSLAERAKEAVVDVANKLVGDSSTSPIRQDKKSLSM
ncbi:hypothetical protein PF006_g14470 [Phytophthora fragariae]|uniref:Uncharacterized protein n=1 Tax=Phytophthora fragariae TaxID=53985 RepID=A0A6A3TFD4_9STRA|nr:hypothetical protein PF003_g22631 [Phytophthora fragariae]KAE9136043.1 hypothetical protein PF006_g14470 [Phytophthora fragariae]